MSSITDKPASLKCPKWTIHYKSGRHGYWIGTAWEFYDEETDAQKRYDELSRIEAVSPTERPYHPSDRQHLGAAHIMRGEG